MPTERDKDVNVEDEERGPGADRELHDRDAQGKDEDTED